AGIREGLTPECRSPGKAKPHPGCGGRGPRVTADEVPGLRRTRSPGAPFGLTRATWGTGLGSGREARKRGVLCGAHARDGGSHGHADGERMNTTTASCSALASSMPPWSTSRVSALASVIIAAVLGY